ncbi:MAG: HPr family phosphocarrier protein [Magnetococcales bacterium]|nr:HPr family phosphocarrier protein [Magnetococcales bacterium]
MLERTVIIANRLGMHARASAQFVTLANRFQSAIRVSKKGRSADGKSMMELMLLAAAKGEKVKISAEGPDAEAALQALTQLIGARFGEENEAR